MTMLKRIFQSMLGIGKYRDPKNLSASEKAAYQQGFEAASRSDNPYPHDSNLGKAWTQGFDDELDIESSRL